MGEFPSRRGRPPGRTNNVTRDIREAIKQFGEMNVHKLQEWLDAVAVEDPARAFELYSRMIEYCVPRLARTEVTGKDGESLSITINI